MKSKVTVAGGTGFIGTQLCASLAASGREVAVLGRHSPKSLPSGCKFYSTDLSAGKIPPEALEDASAVVNLAGANIGRRWNAAYKKLLYSSRIDATHHLVDAMKLMPTPPQIFINASGTGFYGDTGSAPIDESAPMGADYLATLCGDWEREALRAQGLGIKTAIVRTSNVLGRGGLLSTLTPLFKIGLGGYFGSGAQYMPWIHIDDIVGIYRFLLERHIDGIFNACSPKGATQKELFKAIGKWAHAPFVVGVPVWAARLALGEFAEALVTGQNTLPKHLVDAGYPFRFPEVGAALANLRGA